MDNINFFSDSQWITEILDSSNTGLWLITINQTTQEAKMFGNMTMLRLLGLSEHPDPRDCYRHWYDRIDKNHIYRVTNSVGRMIETGQQYEVQYPWYHPQRGQIFVRCGGKTRPAKEGCICLSGYHQDVTEMEKIKQELKDSLQQLSTSKRQRGEIERLKEHYQHLAYIDMLTALPNRRAFFEMSENFIAQMEDGLDPYWVITLDIDHFKRVNDTYGHVAGDVVLHELARRFKENLRENTEFIGRIGGEEFAIFLLEANEKGAYGLAEKLRCICAESPYILEDGTAVSLTCSFGVARVGTAAEKGVELCLREALEHADAALYCAKKNGRNKVVVYHCPKGMIEKADSDRA